MSTIENEQESMGYTTVGRELVTAQTRAAVVDMLKGMGVAEERLLKIIAARDALIKLELDGASLEITARDDMNIAFIEIDHSDANWESGWVKYTIHTWTDPERRGP